MGKRKWIYSIIGKITIIGYLVTFLYPGKKDYIGMKSRPSHSPDALSGDIPGEIFDRTESRPVLVKNIIIDGARKEIFIDQDATIAGIFDQDDNRHTRDADIVIDGNGAVALPGLVNAHTHAAMSLLRGYADDLVFQDWLFGRILPIEAHLTTDAVYWGTKLACLEMIRTGTTAFNDMYLCTDNVPAAVDEMGLRAQLSFGYTDTGGPDDEDHSRRMTERLFETVKGLDNPRIRSAVGPHSVYTVSADGLRWCAEFARDKRIGIHTHLSETEGEVRDAEGKYHKRPPTILDTCRCLGPMTTAAHCCWLDQGECALLGERGTVAVHNPVSNMKLAVNRAMPYHWLKEARAGVALGTDGCASNNNLDMFEEMKVAALLQKYSWNNSTQLPAHEAFAMATEAGARSLGFNTGKIVVGYGADIILIDRSAIQNIPVHHQASNLVYSLNGSVVNTVICDGNVLMYNRIIPGEEEILKQAGEEARNLVRKSCSHS